MPDWGRISTWEPKPFFVPTTLRAASRQHSAKPLWAEPFTWLDVEGQVLEVLEHVLVALEVLLRLAGEGPAEGEPRLPFGRRLLVEGVVEVHRHRGPVELVDLALRQAGLDADEHDARVEHPNPLPHPPGNGEPQVLEDITEVLRGIGLGRSEP